MYSRALVAIELAADSANQVLERACAFAAVSLHGRDALRVVHVVDPHQVQYSVDPTFTGSLTRAMEREAVATAARQVAHLCAPFGIPTTHQTVLLGRAATHLHALATREQCDLIIIGSHGREGLRALLGSTASAALHQSPVDVMTIRISRRTPTDGAPARAGPA